MDPEVVERLQVQLQLSSTPDSLPCREKEYETLFNFISSRISASPIQSGSLYISGVPGTGKTASLTNVLQDITLKYPDSFQLIQLNAALFSNPKDIYPAIYYHLSDLKKRISSPRAQASLNELFSKPLAGPLILVIDELDHLLTSDNDLLYTLFEWAASSQGLVFISIANTLSLLQEAVPKVVSRAGTSRLPFKPYNRQQLSTILRGRVEAAGAQHAVTKQAVDLAAAKVANLTADARRGLSVLSQAVSLAQDAGSAQVTPGHIAKAFRDTYANPVVAAAGTHSKLELLALVVIVSEAAKLSDGRIASAVVYDRLHVLCPLFSLPAHLHIMTRALRVLYESGLVIIQEPLQLPGLSRWVSPAPAISRDDVAFVVRQQPFGRELLRFLGREEEEEE
eukprot:gnl/Dysnectes_brevis/1773_a2028_1170.p1 GENE.gnl/Dysnectes_brevis/1773_a2028_1170~~gnl/Dysnectes_brevis/1773_a2028_1170.p1  ORF type:complete len:395 (-),score=83.25 gnl/Dysnectes_brevis/1773_a2028_1170:48-1232(-)